MMIGWGWGGVVGCGSVFSGKIEREVADMTVNELKKILNEKNDDDIILIELTKYSEVVAGKSCVVGRAVLSGELLNVIDCSRVEGSILLYGRG